MKSRRLHNEWLSLVERSGPFLTAPVLERVFPQGLDAHDPDLARTLRLAFEEWEDDREGSRPNPAIHNAWIKFVLTEALGLPAAALAQGQAIPESLKATMAQHGEVLRPDIVVRNPADGPDPGKTRLLIQTYPSEQDLEKPLADRHWKVSPATRMTELLHSTDVPLGLVTNGERWMLVYAPKGETTGFASWYASLWMEEKLTFHAFRSLLGAHRFFAVAQDETLEGMLAESGTRQQEVTDQLGLQVRRAVEVLIQSLDRADQDHGRQLLGAVPEAVLYEAALTVMMRLVFLFCAEERGLLLLDDELYERNYAVSTLVERLQEAADQHGEEVLERRLDAWVRLLTTFRAVYGGVRHERMRLPAYGGNLFDPDRFPFLEGRPSASSPDSDSGYDECDKRAARQRWKDAPANPLPVNNRTVLHLLRSLQYLEMQGEAQRLSFRALDIEQIGHVYEGLLDHTAKRATEAVLGLAGAKGKECEIPLARLEELKAKSNEELMKFLKDETRRSETALSNAIDAELELEDAGRLRAACGNDDALYKRVVPFARLIRDDPFDQPVVIRKGSVYVTAGTDRRSTGTHYTPRSLTEPIVQYTLEPLVYFGPEEGAPKEVWQLRSPRELMDLKICDMACGSGAFLVQACRYLSELLVEAWEDAEKQHPGAPGVTPEGNAASGAPGESLIPKDQNERLIYAKRLIAHRCLYGVDKNPLAVEMAKLGLWLLTLAKGKPFTFLDHAIRPGDSLVGIEDLDQLKYFTLDRREKQQKIFMTGPVLNLVDEAIVLRKRLEAGASDSVEDLDTQKRMLEQAVEKTARLRFAADLLISVEFQGAKGREKEDLHSLMATQAGYYVEKGSVEELREAAHKATNALPTFHWPLEFPEVITDRGGFDAFVCNPPFMGGQKITGNLGLGYRNYLVGRSAMGKRGSADLCAYFFLRASDLIRNGGQFGFLATNTIAQGDTREVGLDQIVDGGCTIPRAVASRKWPGAATVEVAHVWVRKGEWAGSFFLDEMPVTAISSFLAATQVTANVPFRLAENAGRAFQGSILLGMGFIMSYEEAHRLILSYPKNKDVLWPYIIGQDLNSRPDLSASRWAINFFDWPLEPGSEGRGGRSASDYPDCLGIVDKKVRPQRQLDNRKVYRERWWQYAEKRPDLYSATKELKRVLAIALTSKTLSPDFITPNQVIDQSIIVLATSNLTVFGVIASSLHYWWVIQFGTPMRTDARYSVTNCFETFPFPRGVWTSNGGCDDAVWRKLESAAGEYLRHREQIRLRSHEGLTRIYNRFHNPEETDQDVTELRRLHIQMDYAVAGAYGWTELDLGHGFHSTKQGIRFTVSESARCQALNCLLELNHERYAEEVRQGLHDKRNRAKQSAGIRSRKGSRTASMPAFFGEGDDENEPERPILVKA